jgi:hypothetical protein
MALILTNSLYFSIFKMLVNANLCSLSTPEWSTRLKTIKLVKQKALLALACHTFESLCVTCSMTMSLLFFHHSLSVLDWIHYLWVERICGHMPLKNLKNTHQCHFQLQTHINLATIISLVEEKDMTGNGKSIAYFRIIILEINDYFDRVSIAHSKHQPSFLFECETSIL